MQQRMAEERAELERTDDLGRVSSMDRGNVTVGRGGGMRNTLRDSPEYQAQRENVDGGDGDNDGHTRDNERYAEAVV